MSAGGSQVEWLSDRHPREDQTEAVVSHVRQPGGERGPHGANSYLLVHVFAPSLHRQLPVIKCYLPQCLSRPELLGETSDPR